MLFEEPCLNDGCLSLGRGSELNTSDVVLYNTSNLFRSYLNDKRLGMLSASSASKNKFFIR